MITKEICKKKAHLYNCIDFLHINPSINKFYHVKTDRGYRQLL